VPEPHTLVRSLGVRSLVLYGIGIIVGAGIYVLIGEVAEAAGRATPMAFLLAGALAALTGLSYAELVARHPAAEGSVAFVQAAFGSPLLARIVGLAFATAGIVGAGSIALGGATYLDDYIDLPDTVLAALAVAAFTALACLRVTESVRVAALLSAVEVGGLLVVIVAGLPAVSAPQMAIADLVPQSMDALLGIGSGTFLAFFAYIGFEGMANMAEETIDANRTLPRAIVLAIGASAALYFAVSLVVILALPLQEVAGSDNVLASVVQRYAPGWAPTFHAMALVATLNGVLIEIVIVSRLAFGMAQRGLVWRGFGTVHPRTRAPVRATLAAGAVIVVLVLGVPFENLVSWTSGLTLAVLAAVNASLWRLKITAPRTDLARSVPLWIPVAGASACVALIAIELARALLA
jgi:APA family basic amino acid/polyamine antiporter